MQDEEKDMIHFASHIVNDKLGYNFLHDLKQDTKFIGFLVAISSLFYKHFRFGLTCLIKCVVFRLTFLTFLAIWVVLTVKVDMFN